ncbi:MAG: EutN/CcmL family microcompartment protein [Planctomycetes bacterium]|nr:EutN/CcmL family microcompartment protein [Planctomycetota bacterium]
MILGRVIGKVWATVKDPAYERRTLLVVAPLDPRTGARRGDSTLAVDFTGAGEGDTVLVVDEGSSACGLYGDDVPVKTVIVGIVDSFDCFGRTFVVN